MTNQPKPITLIILDGWGHRKEREHNPIQKVDPPFMHSLFKQYPNRLISASGEDVGLPKGQIGNSEVGHLHIGAGRKILQDLTRINQTIEDGSFCTNPIFLKAIDTAKKQQSAIHILGLLSAGGVHSHERHIAAIMKLCADNDVTQHYFHALLDGRDTLPKTAMPSLKKLNGHIASIIGRYYAMDRDRRWERTQVAYDLLTQGKAEYRADTPEQALQMAYDRGETDEFVKPTVIAKEGETPITIQDNDVVIFMNFRADRARQLSYALTEKTFDGFQRTVFPKLSLFITLTKYAENLKAGVAFPKVPLKNILGEYVAQKGLSQLRIAETEKYAHVTYFFNGMNEEQLPGEERELVTSIKAKDYVNQPEMNAANITRTVLQSLKEENPLPEYLEGKKFDFYLINYANPDMVGHSGDFEATKKAIEFLDGQLAELYDEIVDKQDGTIFIVGDHGNAEDMFDEKAQQPNTAHTTNPIPFIMLNKHNMKDEILGLHGLADVAPFILHYMDLPVPDEMKR